MQPIAMPLLRAIRTSALFLAVLALPAGLVQAKGGHGGGHGGGHHRGGAAYHAAAVRQPATSNRRLAARSASAINRPGAGSGSGTQLARNGALNSRPNLNSNQTFAQPNTLNNGMPGNGAFGSQGLGNFGPSFLGSGGYYGNGYGNRGYGYGNGGYGYGGYGYRNPGYVMVYLPGVGWVLVPIRAIRRY
jgi:hypothetical protein